MQELPACVHAHWSPFLQAGQALSKTSSLQAGQALSRTFSLFLPSSKPAGQQKERTSRPELLPPSKQEAVVSFFLPPSRPTSKKLIIGRFAREQVNKKMAFSDKQSIFFTKKEDFQTVYGLRQVGVNPRDLLDKNIPKEAWLAVFKELHSGKGATKARLVRDDFKEEVRALHRAVYQEDKITNGELSIAFANGLAFHFGMPPQNQLYGQRRP